MIDSCTRHTLDTREPACQMEEKDDDAGLRASPETPPCSASRLSSDGSGHAASSGWAAQGSALGGSRAGSWRSMLDAQVRGTAIVWVRLRPARAVCGRAHARAPPLSARARAQDAQLAAYPLSHAGSGGVDETQSVGSRGTRVTSGYTPKSFHSANVKEVYLEEWLHAANAHVPAQPDEAAARRRLGDGAAEGAGEIIVIIDSVVECQRRSPWVTWGKFPLFPVGDPPPLSELCSRVRNSRSLVGVRA